jgi:hypothetical protein
MNNKIIVFWNDAVHFTTQVATFRSNVLSVEAPGSAETLQFIYQSTLCHVQYDRTQNKILEHTRFRDTNSQ